MDDVLNPTRRRLAVIAIAMVTLLSACSKKTDDTSKTSDDTGTQKAEAEATKDATPEPEPEPEPSKRTTMHPWRALLTEVPRAELRAGGLYIDLGSAESFKYTRGGWQNRWEEIGQDEDGTTFTKLDGKSAPLDLDVAPSDHAAELSVRARSKCSKPQKMTLGMDGKELGSAELTGEWSVTRVPLDRLEPGAHVMDLGMASKCKGEARAEIDWVWLNETAGADPSPVLSVRRAPASIGGKTRRALIAPEPRTYSFFLHVPDGAHLVFDHGATGGAPTFVVRAQTDGEQPKELFSGTAGAEWAEGSVDLSAFSGKAIRLELTTEGKGEGAGWGEPELMIPEAPEAPEIADRRAVPKNLVYILIDTVRADVYEPIGGEGSTVHTPTFDALTKDSTVFTKAYAHENWTKPSVATILSGLYPVTHDTNGENETVPEAVEFLSERMKKAGFTTGAFIANGYVSRDFGFNQGWDEFVNFIREKKGTTAKFVYRTALDWLRKNKDEPFFLYIHTIDPHVPYAVAEEYTARYYEGTYKGKVGETLGGLEQEQLVESGRLTEEDHEWIRALYYGEVTYHDEYMAKVVERLEEYDLLEDTLVVISHDHGEELNDHGGLGHRHSLYEELLRGPLLMRFPKRLPRGHVNDELVEFVDLAPTLLDLMGLEPSKDHEGCLLYTSPSPRDRTRTRMPSSA